MPEPAEKTPETPPTGAEPGTVVDPYRAYNFKLEIQGVTEGHFTRCDGLNIRVHAIRYRQGGMSQVVHSLPGPVEYGDITLRYGLTSSRDLWDWFLTAVQGRVQRKNVSVIMLGSDGTTEVMRWNLVNAWAREWQGAVLDAMGREAAIESLTLVFDTLERG